MKLSSNSLTYLVKRQIKSPPTHLLQGHNEMQGYHQNKSQISIHPIVVYYVSNNVLAPSSLCILSDDFEHDVSFVSKLFHETVSSIYFTLKMIFLLTVFGTFLQIATLSHPAMVHVALRRG